MNGEGINWELFSNYWKPEVNAPVEVAFRNWRQDKRTYSDGKSKYVLVLEVVGINGELLDVKKEFTTSSQSFTEQIRPVIERAESRGENTIVVNIEKRSDKAYAIVDMNLVRELAKPVRKTYTGVKNEENKNKTPVY